MTKRNKIMSAPDSKVKVEGKKFHRRHTNKAAKDQEYVSTNTGVQNLTFNVGHPRHAARYQQSVEGLALYIQSNYTNGYSIAKSIRDLKLVTIEIDPYPVAEDGSGGQPDQRQILIWTQTVNGQVKEQRMLAENVKKAYTLIMGQCSPTLVSKIKGSDKYTEAGVPPPRFFLGFIFFGGLRFSTLSHEIGERGKHFTTLRPHVAVVLDHSEEVSQPFDVLWRF